MKLLHRGTTGEGGVASRPSLTAKLLLIGMMVLIVIVTWYEMNNPPLVKP